jgi:hypothetical protein
MSGTFVKIDVDGTVTKERTELKGSAPYDPLSRLVGGFVERVKVRYEGKLRDAYVDEDGFAKYTYKPNITATKLF